MNQHQYNLKKIRERSVDVYRRKLRREGHMIEGVLGANGKPITPEETQIENTKKSILTIEGLFFAINSATFALRFHDPMIKGMEFLGKMHERLLAELGPEEIQKMRDQYKTQPPPTPA